ncbi:MAG: SCP2 sterol-binding domain-containing protein [Lachnospiraceae bacterium]|nr:SCP2 sterol-binding domain-containing protein [Lachnospiraceae bacterium]MBQ1171535.1 SCP2 sterol-binding domain-containing protein [Lachnospiraceae bacterium]
MTYEEIVAYTKKKVAAANFKSYKGHLAAQVNITGEGEGAFYIELNDAAVAVEPYEYYDRDVILVSNADVFIAILDGKKAAQDAVAAGELKLVGNVEKAFELAEALKKKAPAKKATPAAKKATPAKKAEAKPVAKPVAKKAAPAKKATPAKKAEAKPAVKKEAPVKKAEEKPVVAKTVEKATADTKKSAVATAKKNVTKKVTK